MAVTVRGNLLTGALTMPWLLITGTSSPWTAPVLAALSTAAVGNSVVYRRVWQR
ncbi:hypothetical protein [Streptomyces sp. NPDC058426]|uniref:hypothetical protein n=1 Tax=Streptomyces sp. NPDC058426 TaxID=3346493 RepID=UPI00365A7A53